MAADGSTFKGGEVNQDLLERLARESGMEWPDGEEFSVLAKKDEVRRFAALVAERCAIECDLQLHNEGILLSNPPQSAAARNAARAIRAMFQEPKNV